MFVIFLSVQMIYNLSPRSSRIPPPPLLRAQCVAAMKARRAVNVMGRGWLFLTSNKTHRPSPQISPPGGGGVRGSCPRRHMTAAACQHIAWVCMWLLSEILTVHFFLQGFSCHMWPKTKSTTQNVNRRWLVSYLLYIPLSCMSQHQSTFAFFKIKVHDINSNWLILELSNIT